MDLFVAVMELSELFLSLWTGSDEFFGVNAIFVAEIVVDYHVHVFICWGNVELLLNAV